MEFRLRRNGRSLLGFLTTPRDHDEDRRWPGYLLGGHVRTSTVVLVIAFLATWWVYHTYRPEPAAGQPPAQVVPPGFVPDPNYTWVPRTKVQQPPKHGPGDTGAAVWAGPHAQRTTTLELSLDCRSQKRG